MSNNRKALIVTSVAWIVAQMAAYLYFDKSSAGMVAIFSLPFLPVVFIMVEDSL